MCEHPVRLAFIPPDRSPYRSNPAACRAVVALCNRSQSSSVRGSTVLFLRRSAGTRTCVGKLGMAQGEHLNCSVDAARLGIAADYQQPPLL